MEREKSTLQGKDAHAPSTRKGSKWAHFEMGKNRKTRCAKKKTKHFPQENRSFLCSNGEKTILFFGKSRSEEVFYGDLKLEKVPRPEKKKKNAVECALCLLFCETAS